MTDVARLTVPVEADLAPLEAALARVPGLLQNAGVQAIAASSQFATLGDAGTAALVRLSGQVTATLSTFERLNRAGLTGLLGQIQSVSEADAVASAAQKAHAAEVAAAKRTVASAVREIEAAENRAAQAARATAEQEVAAASRVKAAHQAAVSRAESARGTAVSQVSGVAGQVGAAATRGGLAIVGDLAAAVKVTGEYESALNVLQATAHLSNAEMKQADELSVQLGADQTLPATSAKTAADAMLALARAGVTHNDIFAAAKPVLQLSAAGHLSIEKAATLAGRALNIFHLQGSQANTVVDVMASLVSAAGSQIVQTGEAFRRGGSQAQQAGVGIHDFGTEVALMARSGITGGAAGTQLAAMLKSIESPTAAARAEMQRLGFTLFDSSGHMKDQRTIIAQLGGAINGLSEQGRIEATNSLFTANARRAANVVLLGGVEAYDRMAKKVGEAGAAQKLSDANMKGHVGTVENFNSQIETLQINIGRLLIPEVDKGVKSVSHLVEQFNALSASDKGVIVKTVEAVTGLLLIGGGLATFVNIVGTLATAWKSVATWAALAKAAQAVPGVPGAATGGAGGSLLGTAVGGAARVLGGAAGVALLAPAMLIGSQEEAGAGGDIDQSKKAANDQLILTATRLQKAKADLDYFNRMSAAGQQGTTNAQFGTNLFGQPNRSAGDYLREQQANVRALEEHIKTLQVQVAAANSAAALAHATATKAGASAGAGAGANPKEQEKFSKLLTAEQARLNEAQAGGDRAAQSYAVQIRGLTEAHRAQLTTLHDQVESLNAAEKARAKQAATEQKFHAELMAAENGIRAAHGTEVSGLEKLKAAYPQVSEARLHYLLSQEQNAKAAETEHKTLEKLSETLGQLRSEVEDGTAKNGVHKIAVDLTHQSYASLSGAAQDLVGEIAAVKQQMADTKALEVAKEKADKLAESLRDKVGEAMEKLKVLQLPPLERQLVSFVGGVKVFDQMSASVQEAARAQFILTKAHEAAGSAWEAGTRGVGLYDAALLSVQRTAAATRRELSATGDQLNSQSKQMADLEYQMLHRVASGQAGTFEQQAAAERKLRAEQQAEESFGARYGAFSRTGAGDIDSARRLQQEVANAPNEQQRMAAERILTHNFNKGVLDQLADESKLRSLQGEVEGTRDKSAKLESQLRENQGEITSFQAGMNKIPGMNAAVARSFDPVVISLQKTGAAFDALGKSAEAAMAKINFPQGGFPPERQGINGSGLGNIAQGITGSDGSVYSQSHQQGVFAGDGFAQGVKDSSQAAQQASGAMAQRAIDTVSDMLGIQSPSTVFAQIGQYTVDGLAVGIKNGTRTVVEAASGLVRMTVAQAMAAVPSTLSQQQASMQAGISEQFAAEVVRKARQANLLLGESLGASNPAGVGAFEDAQYAELKREAMNYSSLTVGGQTINRSDSASQLSGGSGGHTFNIHMNVNTPDVAGFQNSRGQLMQQMYEEAADYVRRNG